MKNHRVQLYLLLFLFLQISVHAQEVLLPSGGTISGVGGSASFSVGQTEYSTSAGVNGVSIAGVQQPYEITVITDNQNIDKSAIAVRIYPNPTSNFLNIDINNPQLTDLNFKLIDVNGKVLNILKQESNQIIFNMTNLISGTYFINVYELEKEIKVFKIVKK
jgi:hypothetical protein